MHVEFTDKASGEHVMQCVKFARRVEAARAAAAAQGEEYMHEAWHGNGQAANNKPQSV